MADAAVKEKQVKLQVANARAEESGGGIARIPRSAMAELGEMLEDYGDKPGALKLYRRVLALDPQMHLAAERAKALEKAVEGQGI